VLIATPLPEHAVTKEHMYSDGLSIRRLPAIDWSQAAAKGVVTPIEFEEFAKNEFWLCGDWDIPQGIGFIVL
jgi:hypothetical protein